MQEFDLQNIWQDTHQDAENWYHKRRDQLLAQARQRSQHVLLKLRRQFMWEIVLSLVLGAVLIVLFYQPQQLFFWAAATFWVASLILLSRIYYQFQQAVKHLPLRDVKSSTTDFLYLLRKHAKRLVRLYWILGPLGLITGYFVGFFQGSKANYAALDDWRFWAISIPILALTGWLFTFYARWRYHRTIERREEELEAVLQTLEEDS